jgi:hypothetical protein
MANQQYDPWPRIPTLPDLGGGGFDLWEAYKESMANEVKGEIAKRKTLASIFVAQKKAKADRVEKSIKSFNDQLQAAKTPSSKALVRAGARSFADRHKNNPMVQERTLLARYGVLDPRIDAAEDYGRNFPEKKMPEGLKPEDDPVGYGSVHFYNSDRANNIAAIKSGISLSEAQREDAYLTGTETNSEGKVISKFLTRLKNTDGSESFVMRSTTDHYLDEMKKNTGYTGPEILANNGVMSKKEQIFVGGEFIQQETQIDLFNNKGWQKNKLGYGEKEIRTPNVEKLNKQDKLKFSFLTAVASGRESSGPNDHGANLRDAIDGLRELEYGNRMIEHTLMQAGLPDNVAIWLDEGKFGRSLGSPTSWWRKNAYIAGKAEFPMIVPGKWMSLKLKDSKQGEGVDVIWDMSDDTIKDNRGKPIQVNYIDENGEFQTYEAKTYNDTQTLLSNLTKKQLADGKISMQQIADAKSGKTLPGPAQKPQPDQPIENVIAEIMTSDGDPDKMNFWKRAAAEMQITNEMLSGFFSMREQGVDALANYLDQYSAWVKKTEGGRGILSGIWGKFSKERFKAAMRLKTQGETE